ncbi:MAG: hypothetical protein JXA16_10780 [Bacteroidales bacterium]|nr:hypothetical protein [Bacteroidales bacterium]
MRKKIIIYFSAIILIFLSACSSDMKKYENSEAMVKDAISVAKLINIDDFKTVFDKKDVKILLVDCREESEYKEGHIPGAINIPRGMLEFSKDLTDRRVKLYVYSQTTDRAALAYESLKKLKFSKLSIIEGGWVAWTDKYPDLKEEGSGDAHKGEAKEEESSGGCGG